MVLGIQNSAFSIRITSLYGSQPSTVVFACKTAAFGSEILVSMGSRHHQCFFCIENSAYSTRIASLYGSQPTSVVFACKTATFGPELQVSMGTRYHLWFFAFKTATLALELQVSNNPCPHLWFLHAKQRLFDENYKSPRVPDLTCRFEHVKLCD